jgi:hypothetical protein
MMREREELQHESLNLRITDYYSLFKDKGRFGRDAVRQEIILDMSR